MEGEATGNLRRDSSRDGADRVVRHAEKKQVAGERARRSNFVYGSSKAGLDTFSQGLADSLVGSGANVLVVRPGFVHSKMTDGLKPAPMSTTPDAVAETIIDGVASGATTVWVPSTMRWFMSVLRHLPRPVFRRLPI